MKKKTEIKIGQKFELAVDQDMWKDNLSNVFLRAPCKARLSRPIGTNYRTQLEWMNKYRFKNPNEVLFKEDEGNTWFEIKENMNIARVKEAIAKGILVSKGTVKRTKKIEKSEKRLFRTDPITGETVYNGSNKNIWMLLQKNKNKDLVDVIEKIQNPELLEIMSDMEQRGWNPTGAPRADITNIIQKQLREKSIGLSSIKEEEVKEEYLASNNINTEVNPDDLATQLNKRK